MIYGDTICDVCECVCSDDGGERICLYCKEERELEEREA